MPFYILQENGDKILLEDGTDKLLLETRTTTVQTLDGSLSFDGSIQRQTTKTLSGSVSFSGTVSRIVTKLLSGSLSFVGSLTKKIFRDLSGFIDFVGDLIGIRPVRGKRAYSPMLVSPHSSVLTVAKSPTMAFDAPLVPIATLLAQELSMVASVQLSPSAGSSMEAVTAPYLSVSSAPPDASLESKSFSATLSVET